MVRSFLPVGQGAFYCECFEQAGTQDMLNVVYDCGSLTSRQIVEQEIKNNFRRGENIDALFISHLDEDHVNGIPYLLKHCSVKRIYFPLITEKNRGLMEIYYRVNDIDGFSFRFFMDPAEAVRNVTAETETRVIGIGEADAENEGENLQRETEYHRSGEDVFETIKRPYDSLLPLYDKWLYIPFNFRQTKRVQILLDNLKIQFQRDITEVELVRLWEKGHPGDRDKIKQAYLNVPGGLNVNSMVLFSGEIDHGLRQYRHGGCGGYCCCGDTPSGCLFTGDYDAAGAMKWKELKGAFQRYWAYIGCVQIPHHGSRHNFNADFVRMRAFFVLSAGYANRYHHPHASVIKAFLLRGIMPHIVTEQPGSAVFFVID